MNVNKKRRMKMKNFKLLTIAVVLAELMLVNHNAMAAEQDGTPMSRKIRARRKGGLFAVKRLMINNQKTLDELEVANENATKEGELRVQAEKRAEKAEISDERTKLIADIKKDAEIYVKKEMEKLIDPLIDVSTEKMQDLIDKLGADETTQKEGKKIEAVIATLTVIQQSGLGCMESAARETSIGKQAFDKTEEEKNRSTEDGWVGTLFTDDLRQEILNLGTVEDIVKYKSSLSSKKNVETYKKRLATIGKNICLSALSEALGVELNEDALETQESCEKLVNELIAAQDIDQEVTQLRSDNTDSNVGSQERTEPESADDLMDRLTN